MARTWSRFRGLVLTAALSTACGGSSSCAGTPSPPGDGAPPSASADRAALDSRLRAALAAKGPTYVPRTRHKNPDGSPKYVNRLLLESSPYLLQHAHNPVDWFPWGDEAFALARATGKPVFLSVGYSTCHWCHVMEEESFEDEEIARYLNDHFIPIKVDREERADVDAVYMTALLSFTGSGGWPMSLFLTPDREPFFAGTYYPPRDGVRGARFGFLSVLKEMERSHREDPQSIARDAKSLADRVRKLAAPDPAGALPTAAPIAKLATLAQSRFDPDHGGLRGAPKFPSSFPIRLLLRHARRAASDSSPRAPDAATSRKMAVDTLDHIARGGIHDPLGGGFHRYATDAAWRVPHFEKMLYDNALLAIAYLEAGQSTGEPRFLATARETLDYLLREMTAPDGTFYAATDADSLAPSGKREEGHYFTWTPSEVDAALDGDPQTAALAYFGVTPTGNLDGRSVLATPRPPADIAKDLAWELPRFETALAAARAGLLTARAKRPAPLRDDKAILAWNALTISALARAATVLGDPRYAAAATRAATSLLVPLRSNKPLPHSSLAGAPSGAAFLDDLAALSLACLDLFELTGDPAYLRDARTLMDRVHQSFSDPTHGGYYLTAEGAESLLVRDKPAGDGPTPSGNSLAALAWTRLAVLTGDDTFRARAETTLRAFATPLADRPASLEAMLWALDFALDAPKEIAIVLPDPQGASPATGALSPAARPLLDVLQRTFVPNSVLAVAPASAFAGPLGDAVPWAKDKPARADKPTAYVCERGNCKLPVTDPDKLAELLSESKPY